jgi:hypothetical protein
VRLGVDRRAVPAADRLECEADAGVRGAGVALVNRQDESKRVGGKDDAGLFRGLPDGGLQGIFALLEVPRWQSARVP